MLTFSMILNLTTKAFYRLFFLLLSFVIFMLTVRQSFASTTATLLPTSEGTYQQWSPNSGSGHYTRVDDATCNGNTDFVRETTTGQRDSYGISLTSIPSGATISAIEIFPCASKNTSGGTNTTFNVFYRLNGADSADAGGYSLSTTTPADLTSTVFSGLSTVKDGSTTLEIGGVFTAGNRGAKMSRMGVIVTYTEATPTVTTGSVSSITQTSATLSATINPNGSSTDRYYRYDTTNTGCSSLANSTATVNIGSGTSNVTPNSQGIASLSANTTYYYCAVATNVGGTTYGSVLSFTTKPNPPTVTTNDATNYTGTTSATLNSTVNPNGASTNVYYKYGTSNVACSSLSSFSGVSSIGSGTSDVSPNAKTINSLLTNTTYYFCAVAYNSGGTTYGNVLTFTTDP